MACTVYTRAFQRRFYCRAKNRNIYDKKAPSLRCVKRNVKRIQHKTLFVQQYNAQLIQKCVRYFECKKTTPRRSLDIYVSVYFRLNPKLIFRLRLYLYFVDYSIQ